MPLRCPTDCEMAYLPSPVASVSCHLLAKWRVHNLLVQRMKPLALSSCCPNYCEAFASVRLSHHSSWGPREPTERPAYCSMLETSLAKINHAKSDAKHLPSWVHTMLKKSADLSKLHALEPSCPVPTGAGRWPATCARTGSRARHRGCCCRSRYSELMIAASTSPS